jgi:glyoxylase-like metal-dependent hydrolase (beta-lactamase superfamily II)
VLVHEDEVDAAHAGGADIPLGVFRHLWRPALLRFSRALMQAGVTSVAPVSDVQPFADGQQLDVPGRPEVIHTPGHTYGHSVFWLPDRRALFAGDALQTMDLLRGIACEPKPERFGNLDSDQAMESVQRLTTFDEVTVLPGHGRPWEGHLGNVLANELA